MGLGFYLVFHCLSIARLLVGQFTTGSNAMSESERLLELIERGVVEHGGDLGEI